MKKAFDLNVSRAKPRVRLGSMLTEALVEQVALPVATEAVVEETTFAAVPEPLTQDLAAELKVRSERAKTPKPTVAEALEKALATDSAIDVAPKNGHEKKPRAKVSKPAPQIIEEEVIALAPPRELIEVQTPPAPIEESELDVAERRERLKDRLAAVRENPRPEPLPATVAEAGVLAVERISTLQVDLQKLKALNLALSQDLDGARRQAERGTEEARLRMEEARRLSEDMDTRAKLLGELERELQSLEGERDEALLSLQDARVQVEAQDKERLRLEQEIAKRDHALTESLSEEERLATELEGARKESEGLRRAADALRTERDTLAHQVADLTRERAELLEARKALESVHRALAKAVIR